MKKQDSTDGFILLAALTSTFVVLMICIAALQLVTGNLRSARVEQNRVNAQFAADAGLDDAVHKLNQDPAWTGSDGEVTLFTGSTFRTTYQTNVTSGADDFQKFIDVTARTYSPAAASTATSTRKYQLEMRGVGSGSYSVVGGVGGLILKNSAKIVNGKVFINGNLTIENNSQIGLDLLGIPVTPVDVQVAHQSCPIAGGPTYPRLCVPADNAGQPISISTNGRIYGEVVANNQTDGSRMSAPGLVAGTVAASPLPEHDREAQKAAIASEMTGSAAGCTLLGSKTWPANTKINGDVTISGVCIITIEGDVWITGNLNIRNTAILLVKSGLSERPQIMVDGTSGVSIRNGSLLNANLGGIGMRFITYASDAACSPDCADVTGDDLLDSRDNTTISLENSASAGSTEFYAKWSKVSISNNGNIGALAGQTVEISNSAAITFGTSVSGFTGPQAWVVKSYKRVF